MVVYRIERTAGTCTSWRNTLKFVAPIEWLFCWSSDLWNTVVKIQTKPEYIAKFPGRPYELACDCGVVEWEQKLSLELGKQLIKDGADPYADCLGQNLKQPEFFLPLDWLSAWRQEYDILPKEEKNIRCSVMKLGFCPVCFSPQSLPCQHPTEREVR